MTPVPEPYADDLLSRTDTYLRQIETCLAYVPDAIAAYGRDPCAFSTTVDRIGSSESDCDATLRRVHSLLRDGPPPNFGQVYMRIDDLVRLYELLDVVPNCAERLVVELAAIQPTLGTDVHAAMESLADDAVDGTAVLTAITERYVESIVNGNGGVELAEDVETIAAIETECDRIQRSVLSQVFDARSTVDALVVREFLVAFDSLLDAIEDAADHLLYMNSATL